MKDNFPFQTVSQNLNHARAAYLFIAGASCFVLLKFLELLCPLSSENYGYLGNWKI